MGFNSGFKGLSCVRNTEASSAYIFQRRIRTSKHMHTLIVK